MSLVTLEKAKEWLGIEADENEDDPKISGLILAVDGVFEAYAGTSLGPRTRTQKFSEPDLLWRMNYRPVISVQSITDPAGNSIAAANYLVHAEEGVIEHFRWPGVPRRDSTGVRDFWTVAYTTGLFASEAAAPESVALGMKLMLAKFYFNPEPNVQSRREGDSATAYIPNPSSKHTVPPEVEQLWSHWRSRQMV